jgi:FkbM family methyltransferase
MGIPEFPVGGTELMMSELMSRIDPRLLEGVSIFNYIGKADFNKTTVYWNQLSYDQDAVKFLEDQDIRDKIDHFVFVSHWQAEKFREKFGIPGYKTHVLKNAHGNIPERDFSVRNEKVRVCHLSTPWRGLQTLLDAWELLKPEGCELHVFSSTKIYGMDFHSVSDKEFQALYDRTKSMDSVVYRDFVDNETLRSELTTFDIMAYPCVFEETSCIAAIESLSAGLRVVCSNIGALPETTEGWAKIYPYRTNQQLHAQIFAQVLGEAIQEAKSGSDLEHRKLQKNVYGPRWSWDSRIEEWNKFLGAVQEQRVAKTASDTWDNLMHQEVYVDNEYGVGEMSTEDVVIDIGAHKGNFAMRCLDNGAGTVVCVEPSDENYLHLESMFSGDLRVSLLKKAAWSKSGLSISFTPRIDSDRYSTARGTAFTSQGTERVETLSLDDILLEFVRVKILKIDAEGSEYPVLMSSKMIGRVETIVGEIHEVRPENGLEQPLSYRKKCDLGELVEHLESYGFMVEIQQTSWPFNRRFTAKNKSLDNI